MLLKDKNMEYSKFLIRVDPSSYAFQTVSQKLNDTIATHRGSEKFSSYAVLNVSYNFYNLKKLYVEIYVTFSRCMR